MIKLKIDNYVDTGRDKSTYPQMFHFFTPWLGISHVKNFSLFLEYIHKKNPNNPLPLPLPHTRES